MVKKKLTILAIETSCDETGVAVLECRNVKKGAVLSARGGPAFGWKILSNIVASQVKIHAPWGGVVPNLAKREHQRNLPIILRKALKEAGLNSKSEIRSTKSFDKLRIPSGVEGQIQNSKFKIPNIDLIAVTNGPGLEPCLWVGINFSEELAKKWKKPLLGINHMEGHLFSVFLRENREISNLKSQISEIQFPVIALLVSGGHTQLVLMKNWLKYKVLGQTLDDAAGEAFDKVAKMLKLGYPGGPVIAQEAAKFQVSSSKFQVKLPRPMLNSKDYNFSFSGLKTAVLYKLRELEQQKEVIPSSHDRKDLVSAMAKEFQQAVIDVLLTKTMRSAKEYKVKTIILGGGVAANNELRKQLAKKIEKELPLSTFYFPLSNFTGDNAAMIALAAYFRWTRQKRFAFPRNLKANGNLKLA